MTLRITSILFNSRYAVPRKQRTPPSCNHALTQHLPKPTFIKLTANKTNMQVLFKLYGIKKDLEAAVNTQPNNNASNP